MAWTASPGSPCPVAAPPVPRPMLPLHAHPAHLPTTRTGALGMTSPRRVARECKSDAVTCSNPFLASHTPKRKSKRLITALGLGHLTFP